MVIDTLNGGVNLCRSYYGNLNMYKGKEKIMSFAAYMYCLYHELDIDNTVLNNNVCHRIISQNGIEDCRQENLYLGGTSIINDDVNNCIVAVSNKNGYKDFFSPVPIITEILDKCVALQWDKNKRLQCRTKNDGSFFCVRLGLFSLL